MENNRRISRNTAFQVLSKVITVSFGLVTRKLLTFYLGPAGFGDYGLALTFVGFFLSLSDWGTQLIGIREASRNPDRQPEIFGSIISLRTLFSLLAFALALLIIPWLGLSASLQSSFVLASVLIVVFALKASLGVIFDTYLRTDKWLLVELCSSLGSLALVFLGVHLHLNLSWFFISLIISSTFAALLAFFLSHHLSPIRLTANVGLLKHFALESLPMGGVLILYGIYNRIDTFVLKGYASSAVVGYYILAYLVYDNLSFFASFFTTSALPLLSSQSASEVRITFQKLYDLLIVAGLTLCLLTFVTAPLIVRLLSTSAFAPSVILLRLLAFALPFSFLNHGTGYTLIALGRQRPYLGISALALLLNVCLNLLLIPHFGAPAAAAVTIFTEAFVQLSSLFLLSASLAYFPKLFTFPKTLAHFIRTRGQIF